MPDACRAERELNVRTDLGLHARVAFRRRAVIAARVMGGQVELLRLGVQRQVLTRLVSHAFLHTAQGAQRKRPDDTLSELQSA
eukprot:scaffold90512_cov72-Phaeocystis_antarctica.AAC.6